jgi:programmed cell death protein 5
MAESELEAIRQRRMAEMMAQQGDSQADAEAAAARRAEQEEQRAAMLASILLPQARERLARIELVKPEKARAIQDMLLGAARQGAIREKVSEERLIELLEQVNERSEKTTTKVTIQRRRMAFNDSDDEDSDM